jgi:hypothetical protein
LKTSADYDPATDFSKYKTSGWHEGGSIKDPLLAKRVQSSLSKARFRKEG